MTTLIEQLAAAKGIASEYVDAWGHPAQVSEESKAAMLGAVPAYAPYGQKGQGAAVLTATGKVYTACTVENADQPLTISALSGAVSRAVSEGEFELRAAVVVTPEGQAANSRGSFSSSSFASGHFLMLPPGR